MTLNKSKISIALFVVALAFVGVNVQAETGSSSASDARKEIKDTYKVELGEIRSKMKEERKDVKSASTTEMKKQYILSNKESMENFKNTRKEMVTKMKSDLFQTRANALVKQLNMSLENLTRIRTNLSDIITKQESLGKTMTEAKAALVIADAKIAQAKASVASLSTIVPATTTASTTDTDLTKPRQLGDAAIKAIKEARDALKEVARALRPNSSTASTTPVI
jgi:hypothetical protein